MTGGLGTQRVPGGRRRPPRPLTRVAGVRSLPALHGSGEAHRLTQLRWPNCRAYGVPFTTVTGLVARDQVKRDPGAGVKVAVTV